MASRQFLAAMAAVKESKTVEKVLVGSGFLDEGSHDVTVQAVDSSRIDENLLKVTYVDADGRAFSDNMFLMSQDGADFSYQLRALWSALIPNKEALETFMDLAASDDKAFEIFTGMKLRVTLKPGKGVQARALGTGKFAGFDVETGDKVTEEYDEIKDVYTEVKARALKRSYLRIGKTEATNADSNVAVLNSAVATRKNNGVISQSFSVGKVI